MNALVPVTNAGARSQAVRAGVLRGDEEDGRETGCSAPRGPWGIPVFQAAPLDAAAAYRGALAEPPTLLLDVYA